MSLQFDDIARQTIEHLQNSLTDMHDSYDSLSSLMSRIELGTLNTKAVKQEIDTVMQKLLVSHHKPITQDAMQEGDVELL